MNELNHVNLFKRILECPIFALLTLKESVMLAKANDIQICMQAWACFDHLDLGYDFVCGCLLTPFDSFFNTNLNSQQWQHFFIGASLSPDDCSVCTAGAFMFAHFASYDSLVKKAYDHDNNVVNKKYKKLVTSVLSMYDDYRRYNLSATKP